MNDETKFYIALVLATSIPVTAIIVSVAAYRIVVDRAAIQAGLVEGSVSGQPGAHWVKP